MSDQLGGVIGVIIWTDEAHFDEMRAFYVDTLGLPARVDRPGHTNFQWGNTRLTVGTHSEVRGASTEPLRTMINFHVDDLDAVHERLAAAGVEFIAPPRTEPWGGRIATFSDPDGNALQLMQLPASE